MTRTIPPWIRRELSEAVRKGDRLKAKRITARVVALHMALHAPPKTAVEPVPAQTPITDEMPF